MQRLAVNASSVRETCSGRGLLASQPLGRVFGSQKIQLHGAAHFVASNSLIRIIRTYLAAGAIVLPPLAPRSGGHPSEPIIHVNLDQVSVDHCSEVLGADRLDATSVAIFVSQGGEDKIAFRAAEVIGAHRSVIQRESLFGRDRLRAVGVSHRPSFIAPNVIVRIDSPFPTPVPLQFVAPQGDAELQANFARPRIGSDVGEIVTDSYATLRRDPKS